MIDTKQKILDFLATQQECVVSTVHTNGRPQAAVVGFSESKELEIVFGTYDSSRKYKNIQMNPYVAIVFGFVGEVTVQYDGVARLLAEPELSNRLQNHFKKMPEVAQYRNNPGQVYLCVSPQWIRYTDYYQNPWVVEELKDFS